MKYIITENKLDKVVFKYLDTITKRLVRREPAYHHGFVLSYPDEKYGILSWKNNLKLYISSYFFDEISSNFGLDESDTKSIIGKWFSDRYQVEIKKIDSKYSGSVCFEIGEEE
jgi:hypothetical protein